MAGENIILQIVAKLRDEMSAGLSDIRKELGGIKPKPLDDVGKGAGEASKHIHELGAEVAKIALGFSAGQTLLVGLEKFRELIIDAVKESIALESAIAQVGIRSDDASVHLASFSEAVEKVAVSLGKSSVETAQVAALIQEQFGENTSEGITRILKQVGDLSTIGLGGLRESAQRSANVLQTFQLSNEKLFETMAQLFQISRTAKVSFGELSDIVAAVGVNANAAGDSAAELALIVADLANKGITARQAASGLNSFLSSVSANGSEARKKIEAVTGALKENINTLELLEKIQGAGLSSTQLDSLFAGIVGSGRNAAALRALIQEDLPKLREELGKIGGATDEALTKVAEAADTSSRRIDVAQERLKQHLSGTGEVLKVTYAGALDAINGAVDALSTNIDSDPFLDDLQRRDEALAQETEAIEAFSKSLNEMTNIDSLGNFKVEMAEVTDAVTRFADATKEITTTEFQAGLEAMAKAQADFNSQAIAAERALLPQAQQRVAQLTDEVAATRELIRVRDEQTHGAADNTALELKLSAQEELLFRAKAAAIQKVGEYTKTTIGILGEFARVSVESARQAAAGFEQVERAAKNLAGLREVLLDTQKAQADLGRGPGAQLLKIQAEADVNKVNIDRTVIDPQIAQARKLIEDQLAIGKGQEAVFQLALRPELDLDAQRITEQLQQQLGPAVEKAREDLQALYSTDPGNIEEQYRILQELRAEIERVGNAAANTGKQFELGIGAGIRDKIKEFSNAAKQGYELAQTAVDSFTDHVAQAIRGLAEGTLHGRDLILSFLSDIEGAISKVLAQQFVGSLLSSFAGGGSFIGPPTHAMGGVIPGGFLTEPRSYAFGGIAAGPQLAIVGDNHSRAEAVVPLPGAGRGIPVEFKNGGGGGAVVNLTYAPQVSLLDTRGAREFFAEHARAMADAVADQLSSGRHAGLRQSVRGVR